MIESCGGCYFPHLICGGLDNPLLVISQRDGPQPAEQAMSETGIAAFAYHDAELQTPCASMLEDENTNTRSEK
eukprot:1477142-Rhodomonas_salina.1